MNNSENWQDRIAPSSKWLLLLLGFLQGVGLYLAIEYLPDSTSQITSFVVYGWLFALPWLVMVVAEDLRSKRFWVLVFLYFVALSITLANAGSHCETTDFPRCSGAAAGTTLVSLVLLWCLVTFVFRALLQQSGFAPTYTHLLRFSWHNFFIVVLTALYTGLVWSVIFLGAGLFKLVNLDLFWNTLDEEWFALPLTATAIAYGAVTARQQLTVVTTLRRVLRTLIGGLLPLLAVISLGFLLVLPFTGLQPLWDTKRASMLLLSVVAHVLFFTNAALTQESPQRWFRGWQSITSAALIALPIYLAITGYALWLRIDQYGWTVVRVWAVIVTLVFAGYALSYTWKLLRLRDNWTSSIGVINTRMLGVLMAVLFMVNTPLMNIPKFVADHQVERLLSGEVAAADFDHRLLKYRLGKHGAAALESLKEDPRYTQLPGRKELEQAIATSQRYRAPVAQPGVKRDTFQLLPTDLAVPESFFAALEIVDSYGLARCRADGARCYLLKTSLKEKVEQYLVLIELGGSIDGVIFEEIDDRWFAVGRVNDFDPQRLRSEQPALTRDVIQSLQPEWKDLEVMGKRLRVLPIDSPRVFNARGTPAVGTTAAPAIPVQPTSEKAAQ